MTESKRPNLSPKKMKNRKRSKVFFRKKNRQVHEILKGKT